MIRFIILTEAPVRVSLSNFLIKGNPGIFQAFHQIYPVRRMHISAAAVTHIEPIQLAAAKYSHRLLCFQRQRTIVLQQHAALRTCTAGKLCHFRCDHIVSVRGQFLLHQAVPHAPVHDTLGNGTQFLLQFFHTVPSFCVGMDRNPFTFSLYILRLYLSCTFVTNTV